MKNFTVIKPRSLFFVNFPNELNCKEKPSPFIFVAKKSIIASELVSHEEFITSIIRFLTHTLFIVLESGRLSAWGEVCVVCLLVATDAKEFKVVLFFFPLLLLLLLTNSTHGDYVFGKSSNNWNWKSNLKASRNDELSLSIAKRSELT